MTGLTSSPTGSSSPLHLLLLVLVCLVLSSVPVSGQSSLYSVLYLGLEPLGLAVDPTGASAYIGGYDEVQLFPITGGLSYANNGRVYRETLQSPYGLALNASTSTLFVTDYSTNAVNRVNLASGAVVARVTLSQAFGAALDPSGQFLYVSTYSTNTIVRYSTAGALLTLNATLNLNSLGANTLWGMAVDGTGRVYVCDAGNNRVLQLSADLTTVLANITVPSSPLSYPVGVAVSPVTGDIWIADGNNPRVVRLFPNLTYAYSVFVPTLALGQWGPQSVALDRAGRLFVTDAAKDRLFVFNTSLLTATNTGIPAVPSMLWAFNYSVTGNLYSANTCGFLQTTSQVTCPAQLPCYFMTGLTGLRNDTVYPTVLGAGMETEHVTNVGTVDTKAYYGASQYVYPSSPYVDGSGVTIDFDSPFTWNGNTANNTLIYHDSTSGQYREYTSPVGDWQPTVYNSSFTLTLLSTNITATSALPSFTAACPAPAPFGLPVTTPVATVIGDPMFTGLLGQVYQVHGLDGVVYNLISEELCQVNAQFVFLSSGRCPVVGGVLASNCWSHPGSYLGSLSFQQVVESGELHKAVVLAGSAELGFEQVVVDGRLLSVGQAVQVSSFSVRYLSSHVVEVSTAHFRFTLDNSDRFVNQQVTPTLPLSMLTAHGLLGQTHRRTTHHSQLKAIEGEVDDYASASNDLLGSDFTYNQFTPPTAA